MTPLQLRAEMLLMQRRRMHQLAQDLAVTAKGSQGDAKSISDQIKDWSTM
jgi:hypothetical protein